MEVFSIIEGHFGNLTAQVVKDCFLPFLMDPLMQMYRQHSPRDVYHRHGWFAGERPLYHRPPTNEIHLSVTRSFKALDKELLERFSHVPLTKSAACVVAAMYENFEQLLHVANLGNNIAILGRPRNTDNFYDVHVLSGDHSTDNLAERESIRALHPGEDLIHNGLFFGRKYTRAFGATLLNSSEEQIKTQRNLPESFSETAHPEVVTPPYMSSNPEVTDVRIMRGDVVVLGSSWLSDCLSKEEIVGLVGVWLKKRSDVTSGAWEVEEDVERDTLPVQLKDDTTEMYARWNAPKRFINIERNVATHLAQNAMGGANTQLRAELMDYRRTDLPRKELAIVFVVEPYCIIHFDIELLCTDEHRVGWENGHCVGNTPEISSISFPGLCLEDSPVGVRDSDLVSVFPAAINVAATFNRTLMNQRAIALGQEFKGKGVHVALGPMMNLMRSPAAGRNWEGFGGDPYLSGEGAYETIIGIQSAGVQATAKHYINNEQEHFRDASSSNVDDRVPAFYAVADWWATHSTLSINSGLDMTMPGDITLGSGTTYFGSTLVNAVNSGSVSQARINDMATRILAGWYLVGQDSGFPAVNFDAWNNNAAFNKHVNVQSDHKALIRQIDAASTVLLKNTNGTLPLKAPKTIAIVGNGAANSSAGPNGYVDRGGDDGVLGLGWGSGTANFPYLIAPLDAIKVRASADGTTVSSSTSDTDLSSAKNAATGKAIAFVFITADSGEGYITVEGNAGDRNSLSAWHSGDALIAAVASVNKNTVVVVNAVGPINMEAWITNPNITAVVWSGIPGQEAGNGLVDVLYGAYNPSGRLPYTIGKSITDYSAQVTMTQTGTITPITYSEGLFIDYRHFDQAGITPRFEFGFGLSYTTFVYSGLTISGSTSGGTRQTGPGSALDPWLHDAVVTVTFTVQNSGTVSGNEVPQLYLTFPASANSAPKNLKGFDSVFVGAGQSVAVWYHAGLEYKVPSPASSMPSMSAVKRTSKKHLTVGDVHVLRLLAASAAQRVRRAHSYSKPPVDGADAGKHALSAYARLHLTGVRRVACLVVEILSYSFFATSL
ncbi:glycosyl hydrolase family 3 C-terminal domain-containing protein [Mycena sp. CBHHK59/15]|nr:glycosyl hydrolase family 3 C-terminal domain-containing protein [Mycena sp. CBHHK59/15]